MTHKPQSNAILRYLADELERANTSYRPEMEGSEVGPYMRGWIAAVNHIQSVIETDPETVNFMTRCTDEETKP